MSILEKLQDIDRRYIYLLVWIAVLFPLINPLGLPVSIGKYSTAYYDYIDELPEDSVIMVTFDYGISAMPELYPLTIGTFHHPLEPRFQGHRGSQLDAGSHGTGCVVKGD